MQLGDRRLRSAVLRRDVVLVGGLGFGSGSYAGTPAPLRIPTTPAPTTTRRRGVARRARGRPVPEPVQVEQVDLAVRLGLPRHACGRAVSPSALFPSAGPAGRGARAAFGVCSAWPWSAALAALLARRILVDRVRYISRPLRLSDAGPHARDRAQRADHEFRRAHRHRRGQGVLSRPDAVSTGGRCRPIRRCSSILRWSRR